MENRMQQNQKRKGQKLQTLQKGGNSSPWVPEKDTWRVYIQIYEKQYR